MVFQNQQNMVRALTIYLQKVRIEILQYVMILVVLLGHINLDHDPTLPIATEMMIF